MKKMNIKAVFILFCMLLPTQVFSNNILSQNGQKLIDELWQIRFNTSISSKNEATLEIYDIFEKENAEKIAKLPEDEKLVLENLIIMERYNCVGGFPGEKKEERKTFGEQRKKIEKFVKSKDKNEINKYLFLTYGDIISYYMSFSLGDVIRYGLSVKPQYEKSLQQDENFSPGMINLGKWYYHVPVLFGGSKNKTAQLFEKAVNCAKNDAELYFALIDYSQILFEQNQKEESAKVLERAFEIAPNSAYLRLIQEQNEQNISLYTYNKNHTSILQEGEKYKQKQGIE